MPLSNLNLANEIFAVKIDLALLSSGEGKDSEFDGIDWLPDFNLNPISALIFMRKMKVGNVYHFFKDLSQPFDPGKLGHITAPTLLIHGQEDKCFVIKKARELKNQIKNSRLTELKGMNHHPWNNCPDLVSQEILRFME